eukprot:COSAG04_NODE_4141_length_2273_cov_3.089376_1_plen_606_part_10
MGTCSSWYDAHPEDCGRYDTEKFTAARQCCVCRNESASPPAQDVEPVLGCTDTSASNFEPEATEDDGSCCASSCKVALLCITAFMLVVVALAVLLLVVVICVGCTSSKTDEMDDGGTQNAGNPLAAGPGDHSNVHNQSPPDLTHIEGRAVSAAFLRRFAKEKVTDDIKRRATEAAIPFLEGQISERLQQVVELGGATAIEEIFVMFDADGDGKLSKDEFKAYLDRNLGSGDYTEEKWDEKWLKLCEDLESAVEGIGWETFKHPRNDFYLFGQNGAQVRLDRCKLGDLRAAGQLNKKSPWWQSTHGDRAYYSRVDPVEHSLEMPAEGVKGVIAAEDAEEFEQDFARAKRMDELRAAGKFNPASPWIQFIHGDRGFYHRDNPSESSLEVPAEGVKEVYGMGARDFETSFARAEASSPEALAAADAQTPGLDSEARSKAKAEDHKMGKQHQDVKLTNARRWLGWLQEDLEKRRKDPYCTGRDVHRYIIKPETDDLQCRYCELPGMAEQKDPETGRHSFGTADHFFSYNWDSPIEDIVDAICSHSAAEVAAGKPPPYYWIDNFAINQHERTSEEGARKQRANPGSDDSWRMSSVACRPCSACEAKAPWAQ